jgi:hypothetical protein
VIPRLVALLLLAGIVVWVLQRRRSAAAAMRRGGGDGDLFDELQQHFEQVEQAREQASHWSDGEVRLAVEQYLFKIAHSDDDGDLGRQIAQQPQLARKHALATLRDPDMQTRLQKRERSETPWVRACRLLDAAPTREAVPFVRELLDDREEPIRRQAWRWLARIGSDDVADELVRGVTAPADASTRACIVIGLREADEDGRLGTRVRERLFEPLLEHLDGYDTRDVPALLLRWDRERALAGFARRGLLEASHPEFGYVVQAMAAAGQSLPREQLLALLQQDPGAFATSTFRAFGTMLGRLRDPQDEATLLRHMGATDERAEAAAAGMLAHSGIDDWFDRLQARRDRWTETERRLDAMRRVEDEVCSGGFVQYFALASGDGWQEAVAGFDEVQDPLRAELVRQAAQRLSGAAAGSREQRLAQLEALGEDEPFADLDERYTGPRTDIDVVLTRYMLAHLTELRAAWDRQRLDDGPRGGGPFG